MTIKILIFKLKKKNNFYTNKNYAFVIKKLK